MNYQAEVLQKIEEIGAEFIRGIDKIKGGDPGPLFVNGELLTVPELLMEQMFFCKGVDILGKTEGLLFSLPGMRLGNHSLVKPD